MKTEKKTSKLRKHTGINQIGFTPLKLANYIYITIKQKVSHSLGSNMDTKITLNSANLIRVLGDNCSKNVTIKSHVIVLKMQIDCRYRVTKQ